ncbi:MAG: hypothetical protein JWN41_1398 [Thermoleophilia bacterium]|nr:hypothetical protein [Thermoleophilia bacterium]
MPPIQQQLSDLVHGKGPYAGRTFDDVALWIVRDDVGRVVARTTTHHSAKFDDKVGRAVQLFGHTEFESDQAAQNVLFDHVDAVGRAAGRAATFGPAGLLPNQSGGVITSGFDERGFIDSAWNPAWYPTAYEKAGFTRRFEADTWICENIDSRNDDARALFHFDDSRIASERLELVRGSKRHVAKLLPLVRQMLNTSFQQLGYYTQIDEDELAYQTDGLAFLLEQDLLWLLMRGGEPVAFVLTLPDISEFVVRVHGDLSVPNLLRLLATRRRYRRDAVLVIKGTVPEAQGAGYMNLLSRVLLENLHKHGYRTLRSTFVERDNGGSASQYLKMGGRPLHGYTFYERELHAPAGVLAGA